MLRVIICQTDTAAAINVGGPVDVRHKTIDIDAPELESYLRQEELPSTHKYTHREVIGVEVITND